MEINPLDTVTEATAADAPETRDVHAGRLNTWVAVTVALLSTFMGVAKVKDDNIVQAMQQAQADRIDDWSYYQAKNIREEVARSTADALRVQLVGLPPDRAAALRAVVARYDSLAANEATKREALRIKAQADQTTYDALNYRDDQFDLSDTLAAIAISLLAVTSLTQKRWLLGAGLAFAALAVLMGLAGLLGWHLHPNAITSALS